MPIYTRTGDRGQTSLFGGKRVSKADLRVDTYGTVDELNSILGIVIAFLGTKSKREKKELVAIQRDLLEVGSYLANPKADPVVMLEKRVGEFEDLIDSMTKKIPELHNFILPGGSKAGATLHHARTVCRRAERRLVALQQQEEVDEYVVKYLNRLSDLLFTMARYVNHVAKQKETIWIKS
jgi:cob(I)alamin adenosyltransferase